MWPKGYQLKWFRRELPRKEGPAPPMRPGFGQTPLNVIQDGDKFYVGTYFVLPDGSRKPYTVESQYFSTEKEAKVVLSRMTGGKMKESLLRAYVREMLG
tara:strand:- start:3781 stop:4077 length:297 start_codon:yes stop_codon:yes gene_type:complete